MTTHSAKFSLQAPIFDGKDGESYTLWLSQFERYIRVTKPADDDKLDLFLLCAGNKAAKFYNEITWPALTTAETGAGVTEYSRAVDFITQKFVAGKNILSERIKLYSRKQQPNQSLNDFLSELRQVSRYCNFPPTFADEALRDAFCQGLASEGLKRAVCRAFATATANKAEFSLQNAVSAAEVEESALRDSEQSSQQPSVAAGNQGKRAQKSYSKHPPVRRGKEVGKKPTNRCHWCGSSILHGKKDCPAKDKVCRSCGKTGHFDKVCLQKNKVSANNDSDLDFVTGAYNDGNGLRRFTRVLINGHAQQFLIDPGSDITVVTKETARRLNLRYTPFKANAKSIASKKIHILGVTTTKLTFSGSTAEGNIYVADTLCDPAILGTNIFSQFESITIPYNGSRPGITVASQNSKLQTESPFGFIDIDPFPIISLQPDATPIRCPSRIRSKEDNEFIRGEVLTLLKQGIIEESNSPWRSQVVVAKGNSKKRMCIDFASTINRFTIPDAYPIPVIENLLRTVSNWKFFSYIDLKSAYHQLRLMEDEKPLTAFEANGRLFQFKRLPFGVTNGVAAFQRGIDYVIDGLEGVVANIDDVVVGGATQEDHDKALANFLSAADKYGVTFNKAKSKFNTAELHFLGHVFKDGKMEPEMERMSPLLEFPLPKTKKELDRFVGLSVYYSKWIPSFASLTEPLFAAKKNPSFPLNEAACQAFTSIKETVAKAALWIPDRHKPFTLETDASGTAIGGVLSQDNRPIAFVSHKLSEQELNWPAVEKEAFAVVWCIDKLRQFLLGSKFTVITDQQGVAYLLDARPKSAIKNNKLCRWRLALNEYSFEVQYRPGKLNSVADAMSRIANLSLDETDKPYIAHDFHKVLKKAHEDMGHPGINRTCEFIQRFCEIPNLKQKVTDFISECKICLESKPRFFHPPQVPLITAKSPWERLSIDFVGPKCPTKSGNTCFLTVVDEFSRFPFAFPMKNSKTSNVILALTRLFTIFGPPDTVHSDRGAQFEGREFKSFLESWNIRKSRTTPYNPAGNGQCERTNGTIWRTVKLRLKQLNKDLSCWDEELHFALMNIRTLASRATNWESPHNRLMAFTRRSTLLRKDIQVDRHELEVPNWLSPGANVFVKKFVRNTKDDPLVEEARIVKVISPQHALVSHTGKNRVDTVATKYLAKAPSEPQSQLDQGVTSSSPSQDDQTAQTTDLLAEPEVTTEIPVSQDSSGGSTANTTVPRRSARIQGQTTSKKRGECGDYIYY